MKRIKWLSLSLALLIPLGGFASEFAEKGRAIFEKYQKTVVTVQIVIKSKFSGRSNETRQEVSGTVIDASGLVVMSLTATDPSQMLESMLANNPDFKLETELSDIKFLLEDGTEVPAEVVLRDKDLDLVFARAKGKLPAPLPYLDLANSGKAQVLDELISLNRLGNAGGRAYAANAERISAIVQRPRMFYIPESSFSTTTLGSPAFTMDGKVLGIFVMRNVRSRVGGMMGISPDAVAGIIVPAESVLKAAKQAPEAAPAKPAEDKPAEESKSDDKK
jgi:S1-C subfamily serine protease